MADARRTGKGKDPEFAKAVEKAKNDSGGSGWFEVTQVLVKVESPIREYHVTLEPVNPPA
jgi:hypothetical protein